MQLLLLSNSTMYGRPMYGHALAEIQTMCRSRRVLFVPYALADHEEYTNRVREALQGISVTNFDDEFRSSGFVGDEQSVIMIGGGNTFRLLKALQERDLLTGIKRAVLQGAPYIGSSAGSVIASPSIKTTNDMPIVEPTNFEALGLLTFQLNCHFLDKRPGDTHMAESRELRLQQFHEENDTPVLGIREGSWLAVDGEKVALGGEANNHGGRLFFRGKEPKDIKIGTNLSFLVRRETGGHD
jgi:dipeptidase E